MGASHTAIPGEEYVPGYFRAAHVPDAEQVADVLDLGQSVLQKAMLRYMLGCGYDVARCIALAADQLAEVAPLLPGVDRAEFAARNREIQEQMLATTKREQG